MTQHTESNTSYSKLRDFLTSLKHEDTEHKMPSYVFAMGDSNE